MPTPDGTGDLGDPLSLEELPATKRRESIATIRQAGAWARALLDDSVSEAGDEPRSIRAAGARIDPLLTRRRYAPLVDRAIISRGELARAYNMQQRAGGSILDILTSFASVDAREMARALARESGLRYLDLDGVVPEPGLLARLNMRIAIEHQFVPIATGALGTVIAVTDPTEGRLRSVLDLELGGPHELVVATAADISETMNRALGAGSVHRATAKLRDSSPEDSASVVVTRGQKLFGAGLIAVVAAAVALVTVPALVVINALSTLFYLATALFRLWLIQLATDPSLGPPGVGVPGDARLLDDADLPIYTILVPMYKEAAVVGRVVASLGRLDYPAHKLDVLLICEEDDAETQDAIREMHLGSQFRLIVVPDSKPKTKPKACNYALEYARGEMAVIFDAEDDPEPDQLRRVLATIAGGSDDVACVQARLNYANAEQNILTRWFTAEYMMWFDLILPGLERADAPIPLGGTSNHFRMSVLRELDGWDPFNVTEDADLGIRLYKRGYKTLNIDSTTYEEANSQLPNWIRQRSRWMKGHMQTWLVHNRNPRRTRRELGWRGWFGFQLTIGASALAALLNPIYWLLLGVWLATHLHLLQQVLPGYVYYIASINLLIWNFLFIYAAAVGVARRGATHLVRYALISPIYWIFISIATWKGALQLITKPFYWEKTVHGLDAPAPEPVTPSPSRS
jgi:cellulose synthase/poly-beta-1,6-N-acetylglucosamine synthase-like glycosyltransferase